MLTDGCADGPTAALRDRRLRCGTDGCLEADLQLCGLTDVCAALRDRRLRASSRLTADADRHREVMFFVGPRGFSGTYPVGAIDSSRARGRQRGHRAQGRSVA